jgi:hypothetical protein
MIEDRLAADGNQAFGMVAGEREQARALASREDDGLHDRDP